jgi:pyruvate/2-oxoglutarate dehydrogenase complex dihydrolipoamide acyltransferase (E2) component
VLVGAGAVAALIGLATFLPGGGSGGTATTTTPPGVTESATVAPTAAPTAAPTSAPTSAVAAPAPAPVPSTNPIAAPNGATPAPAAAGGAAAQAGAASGKGTGLGGGTATVQLPVRVYNNSTITGLAAHAADDFRSDGWQVQQVSNYPSGIIAASTVYYRPGTSEQTAASSLGSQFGLRVEPRFTGIDDAAPGLIVIVTNDYQKRK